MFIGCSVIVMLVSVQIDINVNQLPQTDFMFKRESFKGSHKAPSAHQHGRNQAMGKQNGDAAC